MRNYNGKWICSKDCPECEGRGLVEGNDIATFNVQNMEIGHDHEMVPCMNAELDYPDYPDRRDEL